MADRRRWIVLCSLLCAQIFTYGPIISTMGVFMTPLTHQFGWSRAEVSRIATAFSLGNGLFAFVAGWLIDRYDIGRVMACGALIAAAGCALASTIHTLSALVACYLLIGAGLALGGLVPTVAVALNWFPLHRSAAVALALVGLGLGMFIAPRLVTGVIAYGNWRMGMLAVGLPMILVSAPISAGLIRTRPGSTPSSHHEAALAYAELPGLEVGPALATSAFWLLCLLTLLINLSTFAVGFHVIPYLIGSGYAPKSAAWIDGVHGLLLAPGGIVLGLLADRLGRKPILQLALGMLLISVVMLLRSGPHAWGLPAALAWTILWGVATGNHVVIPVLLEDAIGPRRFGTLWGIMHVSVSLGQGLGPIVAGALFDLHRSYVLAFELAAAAYVASAVMAALVFPARGHDRLPAPAASPAADAIAS
ncbi:MAG TPA: MFS transporter [Candidatus Binataceae bacterium]|nr:MFS transporter [Candidatus Binataceae bacterium]